ncbi:N-acetyltransferase 14 [Lates japonicus]|uniref:N-acetyltransferase 14 n=1 Tax=Lates japonicus TaxID=270547 RepID=A0AAD3N0U3_LATJO|nr:N-acetyltransferase 14 [Lates japonicus]
MVRAGAGSGGDEEDEGRMINPHQGLAQHEAVGHRTRLLHPHCVALPLHAWLFLLNPRCLVHSFILALAIPVFLLIIFLKITMPRSTGVLGSSRPYWDYVGSSYRGTQDEALQNPYWQDQ